MNWSDVTGPIESHIPIPPSSGGRPPAYPWRLMEIGQSFKITCEGEAKEKVWNSIQSCRRRAQDRTGRKFLMRSVAGGIRIWRTT